MYFNDAKLKGVKVITSEVFEDHRGFYIETYNEEIFKKNNVAIKFVQDDISVSDKNVLRGIHGDMETWKLISCPFGKFYLVVVNCDPQDPDFGKWQSFVLSDHTHTMILVPPKYGNGHLVLSERAIFHYKQSTYYNREKQFTYSWNDHRFKIWWPIKNPILSIRDESVG